MKRAIAFLRAINVGGHTVKMERLRTLFEQLGLAHVETFIASGNVIFDAGRTRAAALEAKIAQHLEQQLGYPVATFIRTDAELVQVVARAEVIAANGEGTLYVGFLHEAASPAARAKVVALGTDTDFMEVRGRELYWLARTRMSESKINGAVLEKALGQSTTLRNLTTLRKLAARYPV